MAQGVVLLVPSLGNEMPADPPANRTRVRQKHAKLKHVLLEDWTARRFHVEYQPQVNLWSRKTVRFEALLRWRRPGKEIVSPKDFIPVAEEMGIIGEIGQWVLEQACADAMRWPENIGVAVNVSAISLANLSLPSMVQHTLTKSGLDASRLELEITESNELLADPQNLGILEAIRALGVRITIDDLDVGHSSLRYLLDFSFDKVKVDGIYASALCRNDRRGEAAREILCAIAGVCRKLNIDSLAEGVETPEQLALIMQADFTEVQGYIFGEAVCADKIPAMLLHIDNVWKNLAIPKRDYHAPFSFFSVADTVNDIIIVTDAQVSSPGPTIIYVNPAFTRLSGFTAEEAIGKTPRILHGPGTSRATLDIIRDALSAGRGVHEKILNYTKGGAPYWLDMRIEPICDPAGTVTHFVGIERDVTLDKRRLDELEYVADRDILTGIPNRRAFLRALDAEIELSREKTGQTSGQRPLCIAWIDVDRFKEVNDSFGHAVGDTVLYRIADRLAENIRRVDTIGRLGGEEFAVCMPSAPVKDAYSLGERLRQAISSAVIETLAGEVKITISVGVTALLPTDDAMSLMGRADAAMYEAKRAGGNQVCGSVPLYDDVKDRPD